MKNVRLFIALAASTMLAGPIAAQEDVAGKGQAKLAEMLEGRVAGEPQSCISTFPTTRLTVIDGTALVYRVGSKLYVNVPHDPESLNDGDALQTKTFGNRLCSTDVITTFDRLGGFFTGNIFLNEFVPYEKVGG